jgi:hypothetical protein
MRKVVVRVRDDHADDQVDDDENVAKHAALPRGGPPVSARAREPRICVCDPTDERFPPPPPPGASPQRATAGAHERLLTSPLQWSTSHDSARAGSRVSAGGGAPIVVSRPTRPATRHLPKEGRACLSVARRSRAPVKQRTEDHAQQQAEDPAVGNGRCRTGVSDSGSRTSSHRPDCRTRGPQRAGSMRPVRDGHGTSRFSWLTQHDAGLYTERTVPQPAAAQTRPRPKTLTRSRLPRPLSGTASRLRRARRATRSGADRPPEARVFVGSRQVRVSLLCRVMAPSHRSMSGTAS